MMVSSFTDDNNPFKPREPDELAPELLYPNNILNLKCRSGKS